MSQPLQFSLLSLDLQELTGVVKKLGEPLYRARQLLEAVYSQRIDRIDAITTLPKAFRERLSMEGFELSHPSLQHRFTSADGTIRYLFAFPDGQTVETVWMPEGDGGEAGEMVDANGAGNGRREFTRATICISSQAGCAVNCRFCMTALLGVQRNLTPGEIVGQVLAVLNERRVAIDSERINLVFMGQGEPFLNYDNFMKAARLLAGPARIPESRMTVSTAGIVPRIYDFGREPLRPHLAISLNASNDEQRSAIMPLNRKWNLQALLAAARAFPLRERERLTFEYVLLAETNDSPEDARALARLIRGIRAKVNLIALNPGPEIPFGTPADERVHQFQQILIHGGVPTFIRRPRGRDIFAACGQLKRTVETDSSSLVSLP
ncbi:MAG: 23S rRNA (adenine(2503)-C(2))-methyltransferase RlmN [Acidobacteria bacterium]|nr:23S rRNA (adenine(2503)-C(2))-methyltransferase RlmN [Acidobacteriota bacterium]